MASAMGLRVCADDEAALVLEAPLEPNLNDKGTAFAGSLASAATLAGWATVMQALQGAFPEARVAVTESELRYLKPVQSDYRARCTPLTPEQTRALLDAMRARGKAKVELHCQVEDAGGTAVTLKAVFAGFV